MRKMKEGTFCNPEMSVQCMKFEHYRYSLNTCEAYSSERNNCRSVLQPMPVVNVALYKNISENH
jgi:hypothetical protein